MWSTRITEAVRRAGGSAVRLGSDDGAGRGPRGLPVGDEQHHQRRHRRPCRRDASTASRPSSRSSLPACRSSPWPSTTTSSRASAPSTAGATRVFSYRKFFEDGTRLVEGWLAADTARGSDDGLTASAPRATRSGCAAPGPRWPRAAPAALLVGVGPELEWLTGYAAHGDERLNLLVIPAAAPARPTSAPASRRRPRWPHPASPTASCGIETWEETDDPYLLVPRRWCHRRRPLRLLVSDGLRAPFVLGLQAVLPAAALGRGLDACWRPCAASRTPRRSRSCAPRPHAADRAIERVIGGPLSGRTRGGGGQGRA